MVGPDDSIIEKAVKIKLLLTDSDGVLTDSGVYYSASGEELKRFSIRDGMGVERLRTIAKVESGIITGENSESVKKRAEKLRINELHMGIKNKKELLDEIITKKNIKYENVAYIGDDINDMEAIKLSGLSACPADAIDEVKRAADIVCGNKGGHGAFREFAEIIISSVNSYKNKI